MRFNRHDNLVNKHAVLSASKYHWVNYDDEKIIQTYLNAQAAQRGVELHAFAHNAIRLKIKLPKSKKALNQYVNDAIGYRMDTEQVLYYSDNAFGTADAICFREQEKELRIHDLKTGVTPASMHQLEIYSAFFCLEYQYKPHDIQTILRIYQGIEVVEYIPEPEDIQEIMRRIIYFDRLITELQIENET